MTELKMKQQSFVAFVILRISVNNERSIVCDYEKQTLSFFCFCLAEISLPTTPRLLGFPNISRFIPPGGDVFFIGVDRTPISSVPSHFYFSCSVIDSKRPIFSSGVSTKLHDYSSAQPNVDTIPSVRPETDLGCIETCIVGMLLNLQGPM